MPAAPLLADIASTGTPIKAVAAGDNRAPLRVLNRITAQPVWP